MDANSEANVMEAIANRPIFENVNTANAQWMELSSITNKVEPADNVNHPQHYQSKSGLETIDVIEAFTEDLVGGEATNTGNVLKYMCRWKSKNGLEDLKKARWYLDRLIGIVEKRDEEMRKLAANTSSGIR
jgi:hypothetical protein